ncbi:MAG: argininosuccinate lyase [Polyangiaceae bacterium]|nr:argininosuccinate lyase [Polyangiaceae bacterium]
MTHERPGIARTAATGAAMLPSLVAWSSSYELDRALAREDLLGSAAHVTMLCHAGLVSRVDAAQLKSELLAMFYLASKGSLALPDGEEDIHMAVEAELARRLGPVAGRLHTARSRNDQVCLDLRLHVRAEAAALLGSVADLVAYLAARGASERDTLLPAYTHRQRAQPISAAFLLGAWAAGLVRAGRALAFCLDGVDELPLGSGACSGSSLAIDRALVAELLAFSRLSDNALDTVGHRDFALDYTYAASRVLLALGKLSADLVDYATSEFGLVEMGGEIAAGSSMMPQKKNPDVFELVRGKSARGVGNLVSLLTLVKGLPSGYNRDQQEDRATVLETSPLVLGALTAVRTSLPFVRFHPERGRAALADGFTQATDLAEELVRRGVPFREAYKASGALVRAALDRGVALVDVDDLTATTLHPALTRDARAALDPARAVAAKQVHGATGPAPVAAHAEKLAREADELKGVAERIPSLDALAARVAARSL